MLNTYLLKYSSLLLILIFCIILISGCEKEENEKPAPEFSTITDVDGNVYKTVKIGDQWWMAENLKVTKFRNGVIIPQHQNDSAWADTIPAYCIYQDLNNLNTGLLYNYYIVEDINNIAPEGWHIPTDEEWKILERNLGMAEVEVNKLSWRGNDQGNKLKKEGKDSWKEFENNWPNNESGFTANAGSCRLFNGIWGQPGIRFTGFWWTKTTSDHSRAYYRYLDYKQSGIFRQAELKSYGFSIRCVKD